MKIIGIGDNVVDKYLHLNKMFPGGNALNIAVYAKQLGESSSYMGVFGTDAAGKHVKNVLKDLDIDISHCRTYQGKNGIAEVNLKDGDRVFVGGNGGGVSKEYPLNLDNDDLEYIDKHDLIHSSCFSFIEKELPKLADLKTPVSYDFSKNFQDFYLDEVCPHIDYAFLSCGHLAKNKIKELLKDIVARGCSLAVGTMGIKGAILLYNDKFYYQEAHKVNPVDTLGAGDSFITTLLLELMENKEFSEEVIKKGLKKAAEFASKTCMFYGAFGNGKNIK